MVLRKVEIQGLFLVACGCFISFLSQCSAVEEPSRDPLVVQTSSGAVRGRLEPVVYGLSVRHFRGIPYADPPVGELRFAQPQPAKPWLGVREALELGPVCPQMAEEDFLRLINCTNATVKAENAPQSEDCLTLNVYTPEYAVPGDKRAIMVWVHGGGMNMGSSRDYDPSVLVALYDVIIVTINYRVGVLGFFNILGTDVKGNYGMHDQVLALQWVQHNIASFGGNPDSVTLFGESAGGMCISLHLLSPLSKGLFHRVIAQSGSAALNVFVGHEVKSTTTAETFAKTLGCAFDDNVMDCLRSKSSAEVFGAQVNMSMQLQYMRAPLLTMPVIDGEFLPDDTRKMLGEGRFNKADVMMGITSNEGALFSRLGPQGVRHEMPHQEFEFMIKNGMKLIKNQNALAEDAIMFEYADHRDPNNNATILRLYAHLFNDQFFAAPAVFEADSLASHGQPPYFYVFKQSPDFYNFPEWAESMHALDLPYMFGVPIRAGKNSAFLRMMSSQYSAREVGLSTYMMKMWTDFAKHGDPNHSGDVPIRWPRYNSSTHAYLLIALEPRVEHKFRADKMAFWNEFLPKLVEAMPNSGQEQQDKSATQTTKDEL